MEFIFEYGVREYSNLILIFMAEETFRVSFIVAVTNLHPKHQWRRVPFVPTPPPALVHCRVFDEGRSFRVMWYLAAAWICLSLLFSHVSIFSRDFFFQKMWSSSWSWVLECRSLLNSFSMTTFRTFLRGRCFLLTAPGSLWILNTQPHSSAWCCYRKWPQGDSTSPSYNLSSFFFFFFFF